MSVQAFERTEIPVMAKEAQLIDPDEHVKCLSAPTAFEFIDLGAVSFDVSLARLLAHDLKKPLGSVVELVVVPWRGGTVRWFPITREIITRSLTDSEITRTQQLEASEALAQIAEQTGLPKKDIGELVGKSRGTYYNWRRKGVPLDEVEAVLALRSAVARLRPTRSRALVGKWLQAGSPSPVELAKEGQLQALAALVAAELAPSVGTAVVEPQSDDTDFRSFARFLGAPPRGVAEPRQEWFQREDTGLGDWGSQSEDEAD